MATTVNNDVIIYNQIAQTAYVERLQDNLDVFNTASRGALIHRVEFLMGDFNKASAYKSGASIKHRDVNSTAPFVADKIGMFEAVGVKTPWKWGEETTEEAFKRRGVPMDEFAYITGQQLADASMNYRITMALAALDGAIGGNTAMNVTGSLATDGRKTLTKALRTYGDRSGEVVIWMMNSATHFNYVDDAISEKLYGEIGNVIYGGVPGTLGRPVIVSDTIADDVVYGLKVGAVELREDEVPSIRFSETDQENFGLRARAEGNINVNTLGYSWNETAGGKNPDIATLGASANWTKHITSNKQTAGVILTLS